MWKNVKQDKRLGKESLDIVNSICYFEWFFFSGGGVCSIIDDILICENKNYHEYVHFKIDRQYTYIVRKYIIYLYELLWAFLSCLVRSATEFYIFWQFTHNVFILQCQKAKYNCHIIYKKRAEISVTLVVFDDILCDIRAYTVTVSYRRSAWIRYQKYYILVSDHIWLTFIPAMQFAGYFWIPV